VTHKSSDNSEPARTAREVPCKQRTEGTVVTPKRSKGLTLKEGDRVYLFYGNIKGKQNIKSKRPYNKLDFGKLRAYLIEREVYSDVY